MRLFDRSITAFKKYKKIVYKAGGIPLLLQDDINNTYSVRIYRSTRQHSFPDAIIYSFSNQRPKEWKRHPL